MMIIEYGIFIIFLNLGKFFTFFFMIFDFENRKKCPNIMELPIFTTGKLKKVKRPSLQYTDLKKLRSDMKQNAMNFEH